MDNYDKVASHYGGYKPLELANKLLIDYCCENDWAFICVTHPYNYINYAIENDIGGSGYKMELETIKSKGYNTIDYAYTWNTLPKPTWTGYDSWWESSSFYVTRTIFTSGGHPVFA